MYLKEKLAKLGDEIAQEVYPLTYKFPKEERFALADQLRRAIVSVPVNIIEGCNRLSDKEKKQFLNIAYASLKEAQYLLYFAYKQCFVSEEDYLRIKRKLDELGKLLFSFIRKLKTDVLKS